MVFDGSGPIDGMKREKWVPCPEFSRNLEYAFSALDKAVEKYGWGGVGRVKAIKGKKPIWSCGIGVSGSNTAHGAGAYAETVPLAICRAILLSMVEVEKCMECYYKHLNAVEKEEGWCYMYKAPVLSCDKWADNEPDEPDIVREDDVELDSAKC
ncbi:MAG: hypothetical protein E3J94_03050 [Desulfobacteraceae bacterium]|nr:MAG: hypothetical protein E3J94_03050 [Desulfobacteraceae bacterium]